MTSLDFVCVFKTICRRVNECQRKSCKTHTSAKSLHCLLRQRCDNLEAMRHIARPPSLHAECCQSCHLAGELHAFHLYLSSFLLSLLNCLSPPLPLHPLPVWTCLCSSAAIFSTPRSPLCHPSIHRYILLPPGLDHTQEQEGAWSLKGGEEDTIMICSLFPSFCLSRHFFTTVCIPSHFAGCSLSLSRAPFLYKERHFQTFNKHMCTNAHTDYMQILTHTHCTH